MWSQFLSHVYFYISFTFQEGLNPLTAFQLTATLIGYVHALLVMYYGLCLIANYIFMIGRIIKNFVLLAYECIRDAVRRHFQYKMLQDEIVSARNAHKVFLKGCADNAGHLGETMNESYVSGSSYTTVTDFPKFMFGVYGVDAIENKHTFYGTGFKMGKYLFTAAHVIKEIKDRELYVYIDNGVESVRVNKPWVEVHNDVAAVESPAMVGLASGRSAQLSEQQSAVACAWLKQQNFSAGILKTTANPIETRYVGSTRPGFSGSPITTGVNSKVILAIHLAGGSANVGISAKYLELITDKGLFPIEGERLNEVMDLDSGTRAMKMALKNGRKVDLLRRHGEDYYICVDNKFYTVEGDDYRSIMNTQLDPTFESAQPEGASQSTQKVEEIEMTVITPTESKNLEAPSSSTSEGDKLITPPPVPMLEMDFPVPMDSLGPKPMSQQFEEVSKLISSLEKRLDELMLNQQHLSEAVSMLSRKQDTRPAPPLPLPRKTSTLSTQTCLDEHYDNSISALQQDSVDFQTLRRSATRSGLTVYDLTGQGLTGFMCYDKLLVNELKDSSKVKQESKKT